MRQLPFTRAEIGYLRKFFDEVDFAITRELSSDRVAYEEFLTPTLGRLLDSASPFQSLLDYPIAKLNEDLESCGSGRKISIEFETHEHAKKYSGSVSHADLGIIVRFEATHGSSAISEKAILVESKRIYPNRKTYKISCRYEGFTKDQYIALKELGNKHSAIRDIYYFLYNPPLGSFDKASAQTIRAIENSINSPNPAAMAAALEWASRHFGPPLYGSSSLAGELHINPSSEAQRLSEYVSRRPGLRVISLPSLGLIIEKGKTISAQLSLSQCYDLTRDSWYFVNSSSVPFIPFSTFIVDLLLSCYRGDRGEEFIKIANGGARPENISAKNEALLSILARHTLRITIESLLPNPEG